MSLAFIREDTTSPNWAIWTLCNMETVEFKDGPREVPAQIYGSVLTPIDTDEVEARARFRAKKASDSAILDVLDRLLPGTDDHA